MDSQSTLPPSSQDLEIRLLGRFEVFVNGKPLRETEIKGRKARSLLKLIAHQRNHQIVRDHALDVLWPELEGDAANSQLYKALHHIRRAFAGHAAKAADWTEITDQLIRLSPPEGMATDVQHFENAARAGLRDQQITDLEHAVSIYTGDFLPVERYAEWASFPREHYRQLYLDVLSALALQYEKKSRFSDAAEMLRLALDKEPTLEIAHCGLMRIFARKGQATRAFHQYDVCRKILVEELGVSPSPDTRKTLDDIREGRLQPKEEKEVHSQHTPASGAPIIGRVEECGVMARLLENLESGNGGGLVVCGEAGIGKTRLIGELIRQARQKRISFFAGRSGEGMGKMAYGVFVQLFDDILHNKPDLAEDLPVELGQLVPGFATEGTAVPHADKLAAKSYLFAQVHRFFSKLAGEGPAVIVLEDLHEADRSARELLSYLVQHQTRLPVLFVATVRKEEGEPAPEFLRGVQEHSVNILELAPLTYEEHIRLLHQHAGDAVIGPGAADQIYQLSEGNPFYAMELFRHYTENGPSDPLQHSRRTGILPNTPVSEKIPASIHYMVEQKLENLSPVAHHLLYIAAVIGRKVSYGLLESIWNGGGKNQKEEELCDALEEVIRVRLIEEEGLDYSFRHALVQKTIYASISEARRKILHRQTAERLLKLADDADEKPAGEIARHYLGAGELVSGARYLIRAGNRAERVYAHDDALQGYQEACEVLNNANSREGVTLKCEILERIGDVYRACGRLEKSYDAYEEAISIAEEVSPDHPGLVELHRKMAVAAIFRTEIDRSETYLEKAFNLAGPDPRPLARLYVTKALHLWHLNRLEEAYDLARKALLQAKKANAQAEASQACEILAMTCLPLGRWEEGLQYEMERQHHG